MESKSPGLEQFDHSLLIPALQKISNIISKYNPKSNLLFNSLSGNEITNYYVVINSSV